MQNDPWLPIVRDALMTGQAPQEWPQDGANAAAWRKLVEDILSLYPYLDSLSKGELGDELSMHGRLAASLKTLQSNLRRFTRQVQKVAAGDLNQHVDSMGEFSEAFNSLVASLEGAQASERDQRLLAIALRDTAAALNSARSLNQVFDAILANLGRVVPHDAVDILLIEGDRESGGDRMVKVARFDGFTGASQEELEEFRQMRMPLEGTRNLREMYRSNQPCLIDDLRTYDWARSGISNRESSYLGVPIRIKNETVGFLGVFSKEVHFFTPDHKQRLMAFADQAAIAIEKARLFDRLTREATIDSLTGVMNRQRFMELAEYAFRHASRYHEQLAALMLDIDHFKRVNDINGHAAGDQVLTAVAQNCAQYMRKADLFGRYGGEEFVALLPKTNLRGALRLAERLRSSVAALNIPVLQGQVHITVKISIGVAGLRPDVPSLLALLDQADQAMYEAKQKGRDRVDLYRGGLSQTR
jgi:diguanylate cyclase (GGDEF)-like protein